MVPRDRLADLFRWAKANDLALFPIPAWSKQPVGIVRSHANDWSKEESRWLEWYNSTGGCNFGVSCGPSRVIVVDVDLGGEEEFGKWVATNPTLRSHVVCTPTGGWHYYLRVPSGVDSETLRQPNLCGPKVNVRAGRGYAVAPWSVTDPKVDSSVKAFGPYRFYEKSQPLGFAPPALVEHCLPLPEAPVVERRERSPDLDREGYPSHPVERQRVQNRVREVVDRLMRAVPGERNSSLNEAALQLGKLVGEGFLDPSVASVVLETAALQIGLPREEARPTIKSGMKAGETRGYAEPRSALMELLATSIPLARAGEGNQIPAARRKPSSPVPDEPIVERLLYAGSVTYLSGHSGTGKTTLLASLLAASVADVRDFEFGKNESDLLMSPASFVFVSYEGGQYIERTRLAWHAGSGMAPKHPERFEMIDFRPCLITADPKRNLVINQSQVTEIRAAIVRAREKNPGLPVVLAIDNVMAAVENCMDSTYATVFSQLMRVFADEDVAVLVLAHPPKSGTSDIYGSMVYYGMADIVGMLEVLTESSGEWTQWVEFSKHRPDKVPMCLEVRSRRMANRLVDLPDDWGHGHQRARARQERSLRVPFITSIRVRDASERERLEKGVVEVPVEVTRKPESTVGF